MMRGIWGGGLLLVAAALPLVLSDFQIDFISGLLVFTIWAMSLNLLIGYVGLISFGHVAFFGIGAYAFALTYKSLGPSVWIYLPFAGLIGLVVGAAIGALILRGPSAIFWMMTLAVAQLLYYVSVTAYDITRGDDGIPNLPRLTLGIGSLDSAALRMEQATAFYAFALVLFLVFLYAFWRLIRSPFGRILVGIRENENRMRMLGYPVYLYKVAAFSISAGMASIAGAVHASLFGFVSPDLLYWHASGEILLMVIIGGVGTLLGPLVGVTVFLAFAQLAGIYTLHWRFFAAAAFIAVVILAPEGILGTLRARARQWRKKETP